MSRRASSSLEVCGRPGCASAPPVVGNLHEVEPGSPDPLLKSLGIFPFLVLSSPGLREPNILAFAVFSFCLICPLRQS